MGEPVHGMIVLYAIWWEGKIGKRNSDGSVFLVD
jgi:hypothetical protein